MAGWTDMVGERSSVLSEPLVAAATDAAEVQNKFFEAQLRREEEAMRLSCIQTALAHGLRGEEAVKAAKSFYDFVKGNPRPELVKA